MLGGGEQTVKIGPFKTNKELVAFGKDFIKHHTSAFRINMNICLTADKNRRHAYFPGLITCISFLDLLSGLYAGRVKDHGLNELCVYGQAFMPPYYTPANLEILYKCFRHKVAHLSHPYYVFDTKKAGIAGARKLITWTVNASDMKPPINLAPCPGKKLKKFNPPWDVYYDHRVYVSVRRLMVDAIQSTKGANGYVKTLEADLGTQENFVRCITEFFPR